MSNENKRTATAQPPRGLWAWLWRRPRRAILLGIPLGAYFAAIIGVLAAGGILKAVEASSTLKFCTSCHEMEAYVFQEYKQTVHYSNNSGVRAICADCHVPHDFVPKMMRKIGATFNEVPGHFLGRIDTREKFEAHRAEMAQIVWDVMRATDSRECRKCHSYEAMNAETQDRIAQRRHSAEYREKTGKTCIDCHKGIAHSLPEGASAQ